MIAISQPVAILFAAALLLACVQAVLFWRGLRAERKRIKHYQERLRDMEESLVSRNSEMHAVRLRNIRLNVEKADLMILLEDANAICQRQSTLLTQYADRNDELAAKLAAYDLEYGSGPEVDARLQALTGAVK